MTKTFESVLTWSDFGGIASISGLGRTYVIGSSLNIKKQVRAEYGRLKKGTHKNRYLQLDFNEFGEDAFEVRILENTGTVSLDDMYERKLFHMNRRKNLYNIQTDGRSRKGLVNSKKTREAIILSNKERIYTEEMLQRLSESKQGEVNGNHKLTESDIHLIRRMGAQGYTYRQIAAVFLVHYSTIGLIVSRKAWTHVV